MIHKLAKRADLRAWMNRGRQRRASMLDASFRAFVQKQVIGLRSGEEDSAREAKRVRRRAAMAAERVRIGVVGVGWFASRRHLPEIGRCAEAELVAVCRRDEGE